MRWLILLCALVCVGIAGCDTPDPGHGINLAEKPRAGKLVGQYARLLPRAPAGSRGAPAWAVSRLAGLRHR